MRRLIGQTFPAHGVIGEEYGLDRPDADAWVLDPIDGTKELHFRDADYRAHACGRPVYGTTAQPFTRERFYGDGNRVRRLHACATARRRAALRVGDADPHTRPCAGLSEATLATTSPLLIRHDADCIGGSRGRPSPPLYGGDCYAYCALAAGFVDLVVETNLKPHDVVALAPIIEGAGGVITTWDGEDAAKGGRILAAGDRRVYDEARHLLLG